MAVGTVSASPRNKSLDKECKTVCKRLKSEGWNVYGSMKNLDDAVKEHYRLLQEGGDSVMTLVGTAKGKTVNNVVRMATNDASVQYAALKGSDVDGRAISQVSTRKTDSLEVVNEETFDAIYRTRIEQQVKSLSPDLTLTRTLQDGNIEVQSYFIVKK